jgi:nitrogen regulatory protein P-II 2
MKLIEAVISVTSLEEIKSALSSIGIDKIKVRTFVKNSHDRGKSVLNLGADYVSGFMTRIKVEIIATDELVGKVIDTIGEIVKKERQGICRIFIHPLAEATA